MAVWLNKLTRDLDLLWDDFVKLHFRRQTGFLVWDDFTYNGIWMNLLGYLQLKMVTYNGMLTFPFYYLSHTWFIPYKVNISTLRMVISSSLLENLSYESCGFTRNQYYLELDTVSIDKSEQFIWLLKSAKSINENKD